jgi:uncharacterized protein (TIGR03086 family)
VDLLEALDVAVGEFRARLVGVEDEAWTAPTPCDGWDVRYLVAHVVGGHRFSALVLDGATADEAIAAVMGARVLSARPLDDHDETAAAQRLAFRAPGALTAQVDHPGGRITGDEFLAMRVFDVAVHAWDLARATGADERLDPQLAVVVLDVLRGMHDGPGFGIVPIGAASRDDPPQVQLLDLSGRR